MIEKLPKSIVRLVGAVAERWPWFDRKVNALAINATVNVARHRPHPLSTVHDYVSWISLTDRRWSARHLPPAQRPVEANIELVLELFKRKGKQKLSRRSSCLFPAFAQYLTDGFIRTKMPNTSIGEPVTMLLQNTSNHDIDMCPLYGRTQAQTKVLRRNLDAVGLKGKLKSQMINGEEFAPFLLEGDSIKQEFAELDPPLGLDSVRGTPLAGYIFAFGGDRTNGAPQVAMINTLFLREHNRLAGLIEKANPAWNDERVFQVARNTIIVEFIKVVVEEYINHISDSFKFHVDPEVAWDASWNRPNWITTEFSLLYRWHPLVPDAMRWGDTEYPLVATLMNNSLLVAAGLRQAFEQQSSQAAGVMQALNTADILLERERRAIEQGRLARLPSYAAYREYVGLSHPKRFEDISSDPTVIALLKQCYSSASEVEFYVGLFAEDHDVDSPLPPLMQSMVALDAFSQALTNPLLSKYVYNVDTFSKEGWAAIQSTRTLEDLVLRNTVGETNAPIRMHL